MPKVSVIIPSYKDPLLQPTIDSLLLNSELGDDLEIVAVLDGYWPTVPLKNDDRVVVVHLGQNVGMRRAINAGVFASRGDYLMRTDEHAAFATGYDRILVEDCKDNWILTPRRYCLNVENWTIMDIPPVDFMKLKIANVGNGVRKFSGVTAPGDDSQILQPSMAMQGSCWFMKRSWWDNVIGELQNEGYGPHYQDSHEMVFKTWQAGGELVVDKRTWHAHKHRQFPRTHNNGTKENPSNNDQCWTYSLQVWEKYFKEEVVPKWGKEIGLIK